MKVPMLDLRAQYAAIKPEIDAAVDQVLMSQQFRGGPMLERFEVGLAEFAQVRHALGVSSGTDALYLALKALPLHPGDEVITSPFTFFATASAIVHAGCIPVFADIEPDTLNLDVSAVEARITPRTRAILPVHLFGQCARMDAFADMAKRHGLMLIEDAAQALGATYRGLAVGAWSEAATLSFYPTKNLGAAGEGGAILTNDDGIAEHIRLLRSHGADAPYHHSLLGFNSHLHTLQAAILDVKLKYLPEWNKARRERARYYSRRLSQLPGIKTPVESEVLITCITSMSSGFRSVMRFGAGLVNRASAAVYFIRLRYTNNPACRHTADQNIRVKRLSAPAVKCWRFPCIPNCLPRSRTLSWMFWRSTLSNFGRRETSVTAVRNRKYSVLC